MKSGKIVLWVAIAVGALMLIGSGTMLVLGFLGYNEAMSEMTGAKDSIKRIYEDSNPFPTEENIDVYKEHDVELQKWFDDILNNLAAQQVEPVQKSPSAFMSTLGEKRTEMFALIRENNVKMPAEFDLGFKKYFEANALPAPRDVGRLGQQLFLVERLVTIFCEAKPQEIIAIKRELFEGSQVNSTSDTEEEETDSRSRSSRRGRNSRGGEPTPKANSVQGMTNPETGRIVRNEIFGKMYFEFVIKAKMQSALEILNNISKEKMFLRVSTVKFIKPNNGILPSSTIEAKALADGVTLKELSRPERLVSGLELEVPMEVTIGIEVYRFDKTYNQEDK
ncbi:MAG: Amuc_1100 family pilus-like protein [Kiritimatiellae bacterium]|jgi:hypothetical protein|nr:Amuc_1100 family pilus-like protein [Kiritimatiellia bacterium]